MKINKPILPFHYFTIFVISIVGLCLFFFGLHNQAQAFSTTDCWGDTLKWTDNDATMKRLPISFPDGSNRATAITSTESRWNNIPGSAFNFNDDVDNDNDEEEDGDGNEVGFFSSDDMDGQFAFAHLEYDACGPLDDLWPGHNMEMEEADVLFNGEDFCWASGAPNPRSMNSSGGCSYLRLAAMHEFGHALGLSRTNATHENGSIATLNSTYPFGGSYPGSNSNRAMPHGDDRLGARFIYPGGAAAETDIGVLNFAKLDTTAAGAILVAAPSPTNVCPGDTITIRYNFGNIGNVAVNFNLAFYLSTNTSISTSDILVTSENWDSGVGLGSYGPGFLSRTLTIPAAVSFNTDYFVGVFADRNDVIDEARESNNKVALPGKIHIKSAASCP